jgi:hypothetical protein
LKTARRRRTIVATAISAIAHVVVLTILALQAPTLRIPPQVSGPPEAIIPILILPRVPAARRLQHPSRADPAAPPAAAQPAA